MDNLLAVLPRRSPHDPSPTRSPPACWDLPSLGPSWSSLVHIADLKRRSIGDLHALAEEMQIDDYADLRKHDLVFAIAQRLYDESDGDLMGRGILEVLPEGYGFLRSSDNNYLFGPDDIYVSPSQIKRFDLADRR